MGAYYLASNNEYILDIEKSHFLKLMEHSYFYNDYVGSVLNEYVDNAQPLIWLCDYYSPDDDISGDYNPNIKTWEELERKIIANIANTNHKLYEIFENYYILNHTQKLFIDQRRLLDLYEAKGQKEYLIHPIPILTNSNTRSMGGGDYHPSDSRRGLWRGNTVELKKAVPSGYTDITDYCMFFEEE